MTNIESIFPSSLAYYSFYNLCLLCDGHFPFYFLCFPLQTNKRSMHTMEALQMFLLEVLICFCVFALENCPNDSKQVAPCGTACCCVHFFSILHALFHKHVFFFNKPNCITGDLCLPTGGVVLLQKPLFSPQLI